MKNTTVLLAAAICCLIFGGVSGCATNDDGRLYSYGSDGDVVVGSRIRRTPAQAEDGASPVRVYDREEMKRMGARSVGGFIGGNTK